MKKIFLLLALLTAPFAPALAGGAGAPVSAQTDAQTVKIVSAAQAFLATLTPAQRQAASFAFDDAVQRKNWSNFPDGAVLQRKGVRWGDLNTTQRAALKGLLGTVLSPSGLKLVQEQMAADDNVVAYQAKMKAAGLLVENQPQGGGTPPAGAPAGGTGTPPAGGSTGNAGARPTVNFGSAYYFVSFLGAPSATSPWMLQFGGHHLAINATVVGPDVTLAPTLTGGEPLKFDLNGQPVYIVEKEANAAATFLGSLTETQRKAAILSSSRIDLVLGPGQDGKSLQPEGLMGSALNARQKALLLAVIQSRLGILNANDLAPKLAVIQKNLNQTSFSWYGPTTPLGAGYFRIVGPTVNLEFSPQASDGDASNHAHNMYRDPTNEYGAAWLK